MTVLRFLGCGEYEYIGTTDRAILKLKEARIDRTKLSGKLKIAEIVSEMFADPTIKEVHISELDPALVIEDILG